MTQGPLVFGLPNSEFAGLREKHLSAYLGAVRAPLAAPADLDPQFTPHFFGLDKLGLFSKATAVEQQSMVRGCGLSLLQEAHHIEEAGMSYGAKMSLASESIESRMIYSIVSADEARHFQIVRRWLPNWGEESEPNAFHDLLATSIQEGSNEALVRLIQVVLEGWGLQHYSAMARDTQNLEMQADLATILRDEARHHQLGLALAREQGISSADEDWLEQTMVDFLQMVAVGPQAVVAVVEEVMGGFSRAQRIEVFRELETEAQSQTRLDALQKLLSQEGMGTLAHRLDAKGCFRPFRPEDCAWA